jgi:predicted RecB family nuclease
MITITPSMLRLLSMCQRRVWLDHYRNKEEREPLLIQRLVDGQKHEEAIHAATAPSIETIPVKDWDEGVSLTRSLIESGVKAINGAFLQAECEIDGRAVTVRGKADRVVCGEGTWKHVYTPIEIKQYTRLEDSDLLQMDFYVWLLTQMQGIEPIGEFWLGRDSRNRPLRQIPHEYNERRLMKALYEAAQVLDTENGEPPVVLRSHCKECHWHNACKTLAVEHLDVSLLSGLRQDTRKHFREMGITSLHQIAALNPDDLRKFKGIKSTAPAVHAHARAFVSRLPVWINRLPSLCFEGGWMFDIETDPMTGIVWSIGWCDDSGRDGIAIVAPHVRQPQRLSLPDGHEIILVNDSDAAWEALAEGVASDGKPLYHWTGFDSGVMSATAPESVKDALSPRLKDLHQIVNQSVRFPVKGTSIKVLSAYLGYHYAEYEAWDAALNDYNLWLSRGDDTALARSCSYQRDDVLAMVVVWRWLVENVEGYKGRH